MENLNIVNDVKVNCEVYSRVSGYYRPVKHYNKAKQAEFADRKMIDISAFTGKEHE
jgi:anaerobic ribonucleoside-triphosphate reductase